MERTYVMLKPDAVERKLAGLIIQRIEAKGYRIAEIKIMTLTKEVLREHYAHVADKPFYPEMESYMMSGPVWAMIVEGENAVKGMRTLIGATKFEDALSGTIRGDFAGSTTRNVIHGADSPENAEIEIKRFFQVC
ncbi:nucleoside-diphosphate kinase [Anoxybacterium hadale]|uniref:Nucleoside-diphosphate kinase n=1 Tax=Anoxybacterium hadale TaxID=3408580 RepID=A0ACD1ABM7_9FIRM|nr:nucleoside-diphosphate kinase [Clostridiales bacterium]